MLLFSLIPLSSALGMGAIGPKEFTFEPGKEVEINLIVTNSVNAMFPIKIFTDGELAPYLTLLNENDQIILEPNGYAKLHYRLKMPMSFDKPGTHSAFIFAEQIPPKGGKGMIGLIRIGNKIMIHVPYPGKYVDTRLSVENKRINQDVILNIEVKHRGLEDIDDIYGEITVFDSDDKKIATVLTNHISLNAGAEGVISAKWYAGVNPGKYKVLAEVYYDEKKTTTNDYNFVLGSPSIKIINIGNDTIINGSVAKIPITIQSEWNVKIENVFSELKIFDKNDLEIDSIKSETMSIGPWETRTFNLFWDTRKAKIGNYKSTLYLNYLNKTEEREFTLTIEPVKAFVDFPIEYIAVVLILIVFVVLVVFKKRNNSSSGYYMRSFSK